MEEKRLISKISTVFNRSIQQTNFLFELLGNNYQRLIDLELKIKNNFINYCPGDLEDVEVIMNQETRTDWFNISLFPEGTIKIRIKKENKNSLILKQKQKRDISSSIAIPPGHKRTDIITNNDIDAGYSYDNDIILIISGEETRKVYHLSMLQLEYIIKTGEVLYENKYEHIKRL